MNQITRPRCKVELTVIFDTMVVSGAVKDATYRYTGDKVNGVPISCVVEKNDYASADTFKVELSTNFFDFDVSDDMFRSVRVAIFMEDVLPGQDNFMTGEQNCIFIGFADKVQVQEGSRRSRVMLEGRDYTGLLLSRRFYEPGLEAGKITLESGKSVDLTSSSVDSVIRTLLDEVNQLRSLRIITIPEGLQLPTYKSVVESQKLEQTTEKDESIWSFITDLVRQIGLIAYVEQDKLIISESRFLYSSQKDPSKIAIFQYGDNLKETEFNKELGIKEIPLVDVRSYNPLTKTTLISQYPKSLQVGAQISATGVNESGYSVEEINRAKEIGLSEGDLMGASSAKVKQSKATENPTADESPTNDVKIVTFMVPGIKDQLTLDKIAENLWIAASKFQSQGTIQTKKNKVLFTSGGSGNTHDLKNGDMVFIRQSKQGLKPRIFSQGIKESSIKKKSYEGGLVPYFVLTNTVEFGEEDGFSYTLNVGNFIDIERFMLDSKSKEDRKNDQDMSAGVPVLDRLIDTRPVRLR